MIAGWILDLAGSTGTDYQPGMATHGPDAEAVVLDEVDDAEVIWLVPAAR